MKVSFCTHVGGWIHPSRSFPPGPLVGRRSFWAPGVAFTLLEVLIAMGIFFMAIFAILELTTRSLRAARSLQAIVPDAGSLAARVSVLEELEEGSESDFFSDYPDYGWTREIYELTNGLFQVDFRIYQRGSQEQVTASTIILYRPYSAQQLGGRRRR